MNENGTEQASFPTPTPTAEHLWLRKLIGEWTYESELPTETGVEKHTGKETVRPIGEIWVQGIGDGQMPDGLPATTVITLGYDPAKQRFVGTWLGSMMHHLWLYSGELDATANVLTLESDGPDFKNPDRTRSYQDVITFESDDVRTLTGRVLGDDGKWQDMMMVRYRRA